MTTESLRAFAARKGNAVSYWHKQKELGRLVMVDVNGKPMVDVERSEALIAATADPAKSHMASVNEDQRAMHRGAVPPSPLPQEDAFFPPSPDFPDEDFQAARTRREIAEANLAELKEAEQQGLVIRVDAVRATWARCLSSTRDAILQIPVRVAPILAAETNIERVSILLESELRQALTELSRGSLQNSAHGASN